MCMCVCAQWTVSWIFAFTTASLDSKPSCLESAASQKALSLWKCSFLWVLPSSLRVVAWMSKRGWKGGTWERWRAGVFLVPWAAKTVPHHTGLLGSAPVVPGFSE